MSISERDPKDTRRVEEVRRREAVIRDALASEGQRLSQNVIVNLTRDLGVSRATAYRMIKRFRTCGAVVSPSGRPVGRPKGARVLDATRERLIREAIENFYLQPARPKFSDLVREIGKRCAKERLPTPNWRTIRARVHDVDMQTRMRRRNETE
jgi:putative transposase